MDVCTCITDHFVVQQKLSQTCNNQLYFNKTLENGKKEYQAVHAVSVS